MKVEKIQNLSIIVATYWNLPFKYGNLEKKNLRNLASLGGFFHEKSFV